MKTKWPKSRKILVIGLIITSFLFTITIFNLLGGLVSSFEDKYQNLNLITAKPIKNQNLDLNKPLSINHLTNHSNDSITINANTNFINPEDIIKIGISAANFGSVSINGSNDLVFEQAIKQSFNSYWDLVDFAKKNVSYFKNKFNEATSKNNQQESIKYETLVNFCKTTIRTNTAFIVGIVFIPITVISILVTIIWSSKQSKKEKKVIEKKEQ